MSACGSKSSLYGSEPLSVKMVRSEMTRHPSATTLDGIPEGGIKWNYTTGLELLAILDVADTYGIPEMAQYVADYYDAIVREDGSVITYKKSNYNLDHVCPGRPLFALYERTGDERFKAVIDTLYSQLCSHPRNDDGGFWHKKAYPHQMWLDGLYMAEPFYAQYTRDVLSKCENGEELCRQATADIANQFVTVAKHTYDPATGLYRHACDVSREMFWCDKQTGQSKHSWDRAMGWYAMAIVETLQYMDPEGEGAKQMIDILNGIYEVLPKYASPESGMWYQVLELPEREGNYEEATGSIMFIYAMMKGSRLGYLPAEMRAESMRLYEKFVDRFVRLNEDGTISITDCCAVAGLGGSSMRSGDFDYYISEPIIENDCKGVGPFIWASLEYEKEKGMI
ncbi:MAG: glycoside hydrolase family 88 protein [Alistipes sp.]|nr:glycoside hydrolase family 88 protein [Alistipes sp.]